MKIKYIVTSGTVVDGAAFLTVASYWPVGFPVLDGLRIKRQVNGVKSFTIQVKPSHWNRKVKRALARENK